MINDPFGTDIKHRDWYLYSHQHRRKIYEAWKKNTHAQTKDWLGFCCWLNDMRDPRESPDFLRDPDQ